jgi:predicted ATPase
MISVDSFRIRNLRSLEDTGDIDLKPITILVGRNSSGKSTFARIFPLLRQSTEATKRGPVLWWGRLVDFGSFNDALYRHSKEKEIGVDFKISFDPDDIKTATRRALGRLSVLRVIQSGTLRVSLSFKCGESSSYTSKISFSIFDFHAELFLDEQGMVSEIKSGSYTWKSSSQVICYATQDCIIPNPAFFKAKGGGQENTWEMFDPFRAELTRAIRGFVHGNTAEERVRQLVNKIPLGPRSEIFEQLRLISNPSSFGEMLRSVGVGSYSFQRLCDLSFVSQLDVLLEQASKSLNSFLREVIYLEPLRATAQRYYRQQSLAVGEIDSKGENIAMFLDSLSLAQLNGFQAWTSRHFGIEVAPRKEGGHISLTVKQVDGGGEANIADMGFGFSQMLPIAAQLWAAGVAKSTDLPNRRKALHPLIVIEQPELHLHPDYQAKLADVFVAAVTDQAAGSMLPKHSGLRIVAETHSPSLINRLGFLIAEKKIDKDDVQIVLFEQENSQSASCVKISEFDEDGILQNWPIGFFEPTLNS